MQKVHLVPAARILYWWPRFLWFRPDSWWYVFLRCTWSGRLPPSWVFCRCVSTLPQSIWWLCLFLRSEYGGILPQIRPSGCLPCCRLCRDRRKYSWCPANHSWAGVALWCFSKRCSYRKGDCSRTFHRCSYLFSDAYMLPDWQLFYLRSICRSALIFPVHADCFLSGYRCNCSWMGWLRRCHCPDFPG